MTAGLLHQSGGPCPSCNGTGVLAEPLEERFGGYIDGPAPAARNWLTHVAGWSGLGASDLKDRHLFGERFRVREREALHDMDDGELTEHVARLRRVLVMADDDGLDAWFVELQRYRHAYASDELRWRQRAATKGGDRMAVQAAWRERVERVRQSIDLSLLIAMENDGARPTGGGNWKCCCPFHGDRTPSLDIDTKKNVWICRVCNLGGDAFTYLELRHGLDFSAAVRHLESRL